jgi:outer membrane protein OmpA-like peptidoglycan-associated protein
MGAGQREPKEKKEDTMKRILTLFVLMVFLLAAVNCASWNKTTRGAVIGGAGGAVVGGVIGHAAGGTLLGAIIGAAVGGAAGAIIGNYMDKQAAEMQRDLEGAEIQRIGEGIKITFDSGILFDIDKSALRPISETNLAKLAKILNKYPDTNILIEGHTDDTGSEGHNMILSKDRAQSVSFYLATLDVKSARFSIAGYGETQPIVTNDSPEGRQKNRRVDIAVLANDKLKKAAQEKAKG